MNKSKRQLKHGDKLKFLYREKDFKEGRNSINTPEVFKEGKYYKVVPSPYKFKDQICVINEQGQAWCVNINCFVTSNLPPWF